MTKEEYVDTLHFIAGQARLIEMLDLDGFLAMIDRAETLAPILDPTLYRNFLYNPKASLDLELAKDIAVALQEVQRIVHRGRARFEAMEEG
jgi:hypothetical protein